jgi:tetratricopeptide (TPR) repeat protein
MARLLLALADFRAGQFEAADKHLVASMGNPVADLTASITRAWMKQAQGDTAAALAHLAEPKAAEPILQFYRYHRALLLDVAGRKGEARQAYDAQAKSNRTLRFSLAQAQSASHGGDSRAALAALLPQVERARADTHPLVRDAQRRIEAGERLPLLVTTPEQGMAEAYYGLGEALTSDGGFGPGAMLLQFALYLQPDMPFALAAMANVYEQAKRYDLANELYARIPRGGPLDSPIDLRRALNLNALDQFEQAKTVLEAVIKREPGNLLPLDTLGSIYRGRKLHEDAIGTYDRLIALIPKPEARHWTYFYARGTSFERAKKWPQAEADLRTALRLSPDQATVLNYLGYSWVDQGRNLKEGLALIEKAVRLRPDDGYIVDSLGWAHFRLGNFKDAVKWLERAVELRPEDPTLNDHLGDAYWRVGREREARFQWDLALTLKPEPEEIEKIRKKVAEGMPALPVPKQARSTKQVQGTAQPPKKRTDAQNRPAPVNPVQ